MWCINLKRRIIKLSKLKIDGILSQDRCTSKTPCVSPTFLHLALRDPDRRQNRVSYVYWRYNKTAELSVSQSLRRHVLDICFPLIKPSGENRATGISGGREKVFQDRWKVSWEGMSVRGIRELVLDARRLPIQRSISIIIVLTSSLSFCLPLVSGLRISNKEGIEGRIRSRVEDYWLCRVLFDEGKSICTCRRRGWRSCDRVCCG